ncbi:hypothetical protein F5Y08DRAFT_160232 [Xylaria arbuscula]|nr:hypothetical protein F5Y08DRAFT_160232 [Xylaria arbuscula]
MWVRVSLHSEFIREFTDLRAWVQSKIERTGHKTGVVKPIIAERSVVGCVGFQIAEFTIPDTSPNGDAFVSWECGGYSVPSCVHLTISHVLDLPDPSENQGTSGCVHEQDDYRVPPLMALTTDTLTTIITTPATSLVSSTSPPITTQTTPTLVGSAGPSGPLIGIGTVPVKSTGANSAGALSTGGTATVIGR